MRDPKIDPMVGDELNIQGTVYVVNSVTDCCENGPMIGYVEKRPRALKFGMHIADWQQKCIEFPTRVVKLAEESDNG